MRKIKQLGSGVLILMHHALLAQEHQHTIREADVMWSTRLIREIDLRQKVNHHLYYPLSPTEEYTSLFDILKQGILSGELAAYRASTSGGVDISRALSPQVVQSLLSSTDST